MRKLEQLNEIRGLPKHWSSITGRRLTSKAMFFWSQKCSVRLHFIQPGKATQNAFVEWFNGRSRDACLNQQWFRDLGDARRTIDPWRKHYNDERSHSSLGYLSPTNYERRASRLC